MIPNPSQVNPSAGYPTIVSDKDFPPLGAPSSKTVEEKGGKTNAAKKGPTNPVMVPSNVKAKVSK
jgi:hypothetical protein